MKRDLLTLATDWSRAWHKYHDAKHTETVDEIVLNHNDDDWRDLQAKEQALLNAVSERSIH